MQREQPAPAAGPPAPPHPDLLLPLPELPADLESQLLAASPALDDPLAALIEELRNYQAELEVQNQVLNYSQAVAESASERFEALFASVPLPLLVLDDAHDMVIQANAMAMGAFHPPGSERLLASFMPFVRHADRHRVEQAFERARQHGRGEAHEVIFHLGDASTMQGDLHIACIDIPQQEGPSVAQFMCAIIDQGPLLAERAALQERNAQLLASEKRLEAVINASMDAIISVDKDLCITVFNPTAAALFACAASDALGSRLERFLPGIANALPLAGVATQATLGEMQGRTAAGQPVEVEVSVAFEQLTDGANTTVFARDLTSRKRTEAQRSALEAQLREAHKMQALGTMAGGIAHDFNNIVGAILGNVELAKTDSMQHPQLLESLLEIEKAGRRARDLVRQILTFSRNEPPARRAVHPLQAIQATEKLLRMGLPPAIALHIDVPQHLPPMLADPAQVEQALFNLTNNAVHALGTRPGEIRIEARLTWPAPELQQRFELREDSYIALSVRDNGPGMDASTCERVFEPFFTTKPVGQGTGLGLAVVHGLMRTHEGAVEVETQPGQGCCFTLYFPLLPASAAAIFTAPRLPRVTPSADTHLPVGLHTAPQVQHRIMYVDDDQSLVFLVQRLLRRRGYQVTSFEDPRAAVAALRQTPQDFDLVVTDYNMPGYCGLELVKEAQQIRPDLPVALASGYVTADISEQALAAGARALIHKPNDVSELCAIVDQLLSPPSDWPR
jgi:two-component system, cell cycle sensor histidine kinase and response regulator CckA